jgi:hypothetical protein
MVRQAHNVSAGYDFSIWGPIYLGLTAYAIYQALPSRRTNKRLRGIDAPFCVGALVIAWAYVGIAVKQVNMQSVSLVALVLAAAVLALVVRGPIRRGESRPVAA